MARDPVCGMEVDETQANDVSEHNGVTYFFCSPGCKATFDRDPQRYVTEDKTNSGYAR